MADIEAIIEGIETRLKTISGLRTYSRIPDTIEPPAAAITFELCDFDSTMSRGSDDLTFLVHVFTSIADSRAGQKKLYGYIDGSGTTSVKAAIEGDADLGGLAMYTVVERAQNFGKVQVGEAEFYSVQFVVTVSVAG